MGERMLETVRFAPRRLAHANLFVSNLDRSVEFYNQVCGLEEVRREPGIGAGFLTNGNSHHDIGLTELADRSAVGVGGHVQIDRSRMIRAGLNHFGWEMETEKHLVDAYLRAVEAGVEIHRTTDHQISHSVYVFDPEGNLNEFYADALTDWRTVFNPEREDLISSHWDPNAEPPSQEAKYDRSPRLRCVNDAVFHSLRITHALLVARDLDSLRRFYEGIGGLTPVYEGEDGEFVCLKGTSSRYDLVLFAARDGLAPGLHHISFEVGNEDLSRSEKLLNSKGSRFDVCIDNEAKQSVFVKDFDGIGVEFYRPLQEDAVMSLAAAGDADQRPYLV